MAELIFTFTNRRFLKEAEKDYFENYGEEDTGVGRGSLYFKELNVAENAGYLPCYLYFPSSVVTEPPFNHTSLV